MPSRSVQLAQTVPDREHLADLVDAIAQHGDKQAFAELFDYFAPRLNGYLQRIGADAAQAEEVAQDAMVIVWRKAALFDRKKSSVSTWLYRVARNRRIDLLRRDRSGDLDENEPMLMPAAETAADEAMDLAQREAAVRTVMQDLPEEQLSLVKMSFFDGLSHSQISEKTDIPLGTVKSRIRLAFGRLKSALEAGGIGEA